MKAKSREDRLITRILYGFADIYGGGAFLIVGSFYSVFLTKVIGMEPALAGTIPLIGRIWDAITDPIMGNIVERTHSKFGAKRFYLLIGSVMAGITFLLLWISFPDGSPTVKYLYYAFAYMMLSTGITIVMVPYNALLPDMIDDYAKRASFTTIRMLVASAGGALTAVLPSVIISDNTNGAQYLTVGILFAVLFTVCILVSFFSTWERQKPAVKVNLKESLIQSVTVLKSRSYRLFLGIYLFGEGAYEFWTGLAVYYVDDTLNVYSKYPVIMLAVVASQVLGAMIWSLVVKKHAKQVPFLVATPVRILALLGMLIFAHEGANFLLILILAFIVGLASSSTDTTIYSILPDLADVDELITSVNRPGICSSMASFIRKVSSGFAGAAIGLMLSMIGYDEIIAQAGGRQSALVQAGIARIYVFAPVILVIIAYLFTLRFPMRKKEYDIVKKEIARRRGEDTSLATEEEIAVCERVTGFSYNQLWRKENAYGK